MCAIYTYHHTVEVRPVTKMGLFSSCRRLVVITAAEIIPLPQRVPLTASQHMYTICISQTFPPVICVFPSSALNLKCLSKLKKTHLLISNRPLVVTALIKEWEQVLLLRTTTTGQQFAPEKPSQDLPNLKQTLLLPPNNLSFQTDHLSRDFQQTIYSCFMLMKKGLLPSQLCIWTHLYIKSASPLITIFSCTQKERSSSSNCWHFCVPLFQMGR